jgi:hypothetical protein
MRRTVADEAVGTIAILLMTVGVSMAARVGWEISGAILFGVFGGGSWPGQ